MQVAKEYLGCGVKKFKKKALKTNIINVLQDNIILKNTSAIDL